MFTESDRMRSKRRIAVETAGTKHNKELEDAYVAGFMAAAKDATGWTEEGLRLAYWTQARGLNAATISADPSKVIASQSISDNLIEFTMADGSTIEISIANGWRDARLVMERGKADE